MLHMIQWLVGTVNVTKEKKVSDREEDTDCLMYGLTYTVVKSFNTWIMFLKAGV